MSFIVRFKRALSHKHVWFEGQIELILLHQCLYSKSELKVRNTFIISFSLIKTETVCSSFQKTQK